MGGGGSRVERVSRWVKSRYERLQRASFELKSFERTVLTWGQA